MILGKLMLRYSELKGVPKSTPKPVINGEYLNFAFIRVMA